MKLLDSHPLLFQIGNFPITAHGVFFALAMVIAAALFAHRVKSAGLTTFVRGVEVAVWIILAGLFSARLGYLLTYRDEWTGFTQLFAIWQGGLVSFWGIGGGFLMAAFQTLGFSPESKKIWWRAVIIAGLAGWAIGRIGNYYMGDSSGVLSPEWHAFYGRVPIQLFESVLCFILVILLRKRSDAAWLGILGYLVGRLIIDTWRDEALLGSLHVSQWFIILSLTILTPFYVRSRRA